MIYDKGEFTDLEFLNISINRYLIRSKISELGFPVSDDQVESQVKSNEKRLNVDREQLKSFLKTQNTTFDEYFETLREAMEYSYFVGRIITPLISVSDQEVKNEYIKRNVKDSRLNIKYTLVDYAIPKEAKPKLDKAEFENVVKAYRLNSILPDSYSSMTASNLDDITEEGLAPELKNLLNSTDEGSISKLIFLNNQSHLFFVVKKDLVETEAYSKQKDQIKDELFEKLVKSEVSVWFDREKVKHYIKTSI